MNKSSLENLRDPRKYYRAIYGEGQRNGQWVVVLGEAKAHIGGGTVKHFADVLEQVEPLVEGEVWRVMNVIYRRPTPR